MLQKKSKGLNVNVLNGSVLLLLSVSYVYYLVVALLY